VDAGVPRWQFRTRQKRGACVGKTKRGKGTKVMLVADGNGLPLGFCLANASLLTITVTITQQASGRVQKGLAKSPNRKSPAKRGCSVAARPRFEPGLTDLESAVLPLLHLTVKMGDGSKLCRRLHRTRTFDTTVCTTYRTGFGRVQTGLPRSMARRNTRRHGLNGIQRGL
jgi:hypothetical protein